MFRAGLKILAINKQDINRLTVFSWRKKSGSTVAARKIENSQREDAKPPRKTFFGNDQIKKENQINNKLKILTTPKAGKYNIAGHPEHPNRVLDSLRHLKTILPAMFSRNRNQLPWKRSVLSTEKT